MTLPTLQVQTNNNEVKVLQLKGSMDNGRLNEQERSKLSVLLKSMGVKQELGWIRFSSDWGWYYDYAVVIGHHLLLMDKDEFNKVFSVVSGEVQKQTMIIFNEGK